MLGEDIRMALASMADILAILSIAAGSQVADSPRGIGNTVFWPCTTSSPNIRGMPSLLLTASSWISLILAGSEMLNSPPICPSEISPAMSDSFAGPVMMSDGAVGRLSCPIFSSIVILFIRLPMNLSISLSGSALFPYRSAAAESISISDINFFILLRVLKCPSVLSDMELPVWQTKIHLIFVNAHTLLNFVC